MSDVLSVEKVETGYGETQVLFGVSLKVEKGTVTALLGSNGAGKTTLWAISGVLPIWRGRVLFNGRDVTRVPAHKRTSMGIVLVPEGRRLWPKLTVYENLLLAGMSTERAKRKFNENLELVYNYFPILKARSKQLAGTLSGGEQQMLAIARGLMLEPEVLMMDEPSLGLAPKIVQEIANIVKKLRDEEGKTILLVEQNVHMSLRIADYAYVIENGRIVLEGPPDKLSEDPRLKKAYLGL